MWNDVKNLCKAFGVLVKHIWESLGNLLVWAVRFFGPVANSARGVVNPEEFYRVFMMALSAGGSLYGSVEYLSAHMNEFVTDPNLIAAVHAFIDHVHHKRLPMAVFTVVFILEYFRRKYYHGDKT